MIKASVVLPHIRAQSIAYWILLSIKFYLIKSSAPSSQLIFLEIVSVIVCLKSNCSTVVSGFGDFYSSTYPTLSKKLTASIADNSANVSYTYF